MSLRFAGRNQRRELIESLDRGRSVSLQVRLRRTSSRGWGPWVDAQIDIPEPGSEPATWHVSAKNATPMTSKPGPISGTFGDVVQVYGRDIRFRTEAFWGEQGEIIVIEADRGTAEIAVRPEIGKALLKRLKLDLPPA